MGASGIRMGGVFVEIGADTAKFFAGMAKVNQQIGKLGKSMVSAGGKLAGIGIGMAAPIAAAVKQGSNFESTLLAIKASTGATTSEIDAIKASAMDMSMALGVGPTQATKGMLELLKAGMKVEQVLGGAGKAALQFATVGEMDVGQAAVVMSDAMNVFKVSADRAANSLSSAADASSTSITQMAEAFSMSSAVAGLANQSIDDLSATLAILANNGVKGSDAGTSVKTMLMRLMAPADDAAAALAQVGLSTQSFRGADGKIRPMVEIIGTLNNAMSGLDQTAKDDVFRRIFGADAIRSASILSTAGVGGFEEMRTAMAGAMSVGDKFKTMMSGLAGSGMAMLAALERLAIAISDAVAPAIASVMPLVLGFVNGLAKFVQENQAAVAGFAKMAVAVIGVGGALTSLGLSLQVSSIAMAGIGKATAIVAAPLRIAATSAMAVASAFGSTAMSVGAFASQSVAALSGFANAGVQSVMAVGMAMQGGFAKSVVFAQNSLILFANAASSASAGVASAAGFIGRGFAAIASDVSRLAPSVSSFAASSVKSLASYASSVSAAAAATATASAKIAAEWLSRGLQPVLAFVSGAVGGVATYVAAIASASAASVTHAARAGLAWITSALPSFSAFVAGAVGGVATYLGAAAAAVAGSVASAAAVAAAWLAPLAPLALLAVAIGGAAALAYKFGGGIASAFSGIGGYAKQAAGVIGETFGPAIDNATVVFGDLYSTASKTFTGIYNAIVAGDLSKAMDILWAGLVAGWLRGVEALMSFVDPFITSLQDTFTVLGGEITKIWDTMWTKVGNGLNTAGAYLFGVFDNIINGLLKAWDVLESGIRKAWVRVQGIFKGGKGVKKELEAIDEEMKSRASAREAARPGVSGRLERAAKENADANQQLAERNAAVDANTAATKKGRQKANDDRAAGRREATMSAEKKLADLVAGVTGEKDPAVAEAEKTVKDISDAIAKATDAQSLGEAGKKLSAAIESDTLSAEQEQALKDAYDKKAAGLPPPPPTTPPPDTTMQGKVAGTFSSMNLGAAFGGSSPAERTAKATEEIAKNTRDMKGDKVAA